MVLPTVVFFDQSGIHKEPKFFTSRTHSTGAPVQRLIISQSEADLTSHAGLGLIGRALNECTNLAADAKAISPPRSDAIGHANILSSSVALLCLGKSDFEAINGFREDPYFTTCQAPCDLYTERGAILYCKQEKSYACWPRRELRGAGRKPSRGATVFDKSDIITL